MASKLSDIECNLVVLGGGGCGKSALSVMFCHHHFVELYDPTIEDFFRRQAVIDSEAVLISILDTAGQEEFSAMRSQWVRTGKGFVLCYAINDRGSFDEVKALRQQVLMIKDADTVPMVLVANKSDLESERDVSTAEGAALAKEFGCAFVEASARTNTNVEEAFFQAVREVRLQDPAHQAKKAVKKQRNNKMCVIC